MSKYRSEGRLEADDSFTHDDSKIIRELCESDKLTERERLAVRRLYRTYQYAVD